MASADEVKRRINRLTFICMAGAAVLVSVNYLPTDPEPLLWIKVVLMAAVLIW
ncbi:UNVERIFIED_ORG: hypothetical protein ABIB52_004549 [Arthrobacter sp. UYCu721]